MTRGSSTPTYARHFAAYGATRRLTRRTCSGRLLRLRTRRRRCATVIPDARGSHPPVSALRSLRGPRALRLERDLPAVSCSTTRAVSPRSGHRHRGTSRRALEGGEKVSVAREKSMTRAAAEYARRILALNRGRWKCARCGNVEETPHRGCTRCGSIWLRAAEGRTAT